MLDIFYDTRALFAADCALCGYDADALIQSGAYVMLADGGVIAGDYL